MTAQASGQSFFSRAALWPAPGARTRRANPSGRNCSIRDPTVSAAVLSARRQRRSGHASGPRGGIVDRPAERPPARSNRLPCHGAANRRAGGFGVDEIMAEVRRDRSFFDKSGGGLTLSGGEPLAQIDLAEELVRAALERGHRCRDRDLPRCQPEGCRADLRAASPLARRPEARRSGGFPRRDRGRS